MAALDSPPHSGVDTALSKRYWKATGYTNSWNLLEEKYLATVFI